MTTQDMQAKASEYKEYKRMIEEMQSIADSIADELKAAMTEAGETKVIAGQYKITYSEISRKDIDKKRLETEQPEIFTAYQKATSYMRLLVS